MDSHRCLCMGCRNPPRGSTVARGNAGQGDGRRGRSRGRQGAAEDALDREREAIDDPRPVLKRLDDGAADWDVVILDVGLPDMTGIDVLKRFREAGSPASIIMLTGDNSAATATECMRAGAFYYLTKPFRPYELRSDGRVRGAASRQLRRELARDAPMSPALTRLDAGRTSRSDAAPARDARSPRRSQDVSILIHGESGTGKELVARALHDRGARRSKRFVALNCGAMPESLIDSELFGHAKGAFTGATSDRPGVFVEADGGTLFLDEIGDMPLAGAGAPAARAPGGRGPPGRSQQRAQGRRSRDRGDPRRSQQRRSATAVSPGSVLPAQRRVLVQVPPLRERLDDLPMLAAHFLTQARRQTPPSLSPEALELMTAYTGPATCASSRTRYARDRAAPRRRDRQLVVAAAYRRTRARSGPTGRGGRAVPRRKAEDEYRPRGALPQQRDGSCQRLGLGGGSALRHRSHEPPADASAQRNRSRAVQVGGANRTGPPAPDAICVGYAPRGHMAKATDRDPRWGDGRADGGVRDHERSPTGSDDYDITVYQLGWRLGGKGASGRNAEHYQRIEEHGLHILLGFYENAFRVLRAAYARARTVRRDTARDLAGRVQAAQLRRADGADRRTTYVPWPMDFPPNSGIPGEGGVLPTPWQMIEMTIGWLKELFQRTNHLPDRHVDLEAAHAARDAARRDRSSTTSCTSSTSGCTTRTTTSRRTSTGAARSAPSISASLRSRARSRAA